MEWISVKDKLPELGTRCLTIDDSQFIEIAVYSNNILKGKGDKYIRITGFENEQDEQPSQVYPTHWMPLPNSPSTTN